MKKTLLLAPLAVARSAMAQTNKAHVFVSAMTQSGQPITTGRLVYKYQFDRALEREVRKKYILVPISTKSATLSALLKEDGYYWVGGSFSQGVAAGDYSAYAAKPRHQFPMNEAKNCAAKDTPEQCAAKAFAYVDEIIREDNGWVKPADTTVKYYTQNLSIFLITRTGRRARISSLQAGPITRSPWYALESRTARISGSISRREDRPILAQSFAGGAEGRTPVMAIDFATLMPRKRREDGPRRRPSDVLCQTSLLCILATISHK